MHQSNVENSTVTPRRGNRFRALTVAGATLGLFMLTGLAAHTWQLQQQVDELRLAQQSSVSQPLLSTPSADAATMVADPFQRMEQLRQQMDAMMGSMFTAPAPSITGIPGFGSLSASSLFGDDAFASLGMNQLTLDLRETEQTLELVIPVRQGQEFEFNTDVQQDRLTVSGTLTWQQQSNEPGVVSERRGSSQFTRTVVLPDNVDPTGLVSEHRGNEIVITLPKV